MSIQSRFSTKNRKIAGLVLAIIGTFFIIAAKYQKTTLCAVPAAQSSYKAVIFDLGEVLFTTPSKAKRDVILPTVFKNPSLLYHLIGFQVKEQYFKMLHSVPAKTTTPMYHQAQRMPQIMVDWQTASSNCGEIKTAVMQQIQKTDHPQSVKKLFNSIAHLMFDPQTLAASQAPIVPMIHLVQKLKAAGYQIYALSNWDPESFEILQKSHPKLFNLFDGILISGQEKIGKPSIEFYARLLQKYNLNSSHCIFIDDERHNLQAAQQIGISTVLCDEQASVIKELIKFGVVTLQS